jgi:hypothetical protein
LGVTLAHILPRFVRLPVRDTKSPRVKKTMQATFVMESRVMCLILGACVMISCLGFLNIAVHQDHDRGHYREKNIRPYNDAMKIQTPKSR